MPAQVVHDLRVALRRAVSTARSVHAFTRGLLHGGRDVEVGLPDREVNHAGVALAKVEQVSDHRGFETLGARGEPHPRIVGVRARRGAKGCSIGADPVGRPP